MHPRTHRSLFLIFLLILNYIGLPAWGQNPTSLQILIVEGDGAINNVKQRVNREPIVQVEDENGKLRKVVADLSLDKEMLQDALRRKL